MTGEGASLLGFFMKNGSNPFLFPLDCKAFEPNRPKKQNQAHPALPPPNHVTIRIKYIYSFLALHGTSFRKNNS
jgi:hypothetical protein